MHGVEALGLLAREMGHARRNHAQSRAFEPRDDLTDDVFLDGVGLDDREGALNGHGLQFSLVNQEINAPFYAIPAKPREHFPPLGSARRRRAPEPTRHRRRSRGAAADRAPMAARRPPEKDSSACAAAGAHRAAGARRLSGV